jgi:hypothetical protein
MIHETIRFPPVVHRGIAFASEPCLRQRQTIDTFVKPSADLHESMLIEYVSQVIDIITGQPDKCRDAPIQ